MAAEQRYESLVMVPGHAVFVGTEPEQANHRQGWVGTFDRYRENDEAPLYAEHAAAGVRIAAAAPHRLLVFTGGVTRAEANGVSEAASYRRLAEVCRWFGHPEVEPRCTTEEYARDSFENLHFGILRFVAVAGSLPQEIVIAGFEFKAERYRFHFETIRAAQQKLGLSGLDARFEFRGVNNPPSHVLHAPDGSLAGEQRALELFRRYPFGDAGELAEKRRQRDVLGRGHPYGPP